MNHQWMIHILNPFFGVGCTNLDDISYIFFVIKHIKKQSHNTKPIKNKICEIKPGAFVASEFSFGNESALNLTPNWNDI